MFGYIKPQKSELLVREYGEYGGVYCTLCRRLGKDYGPSARLVLNYDCTFYALVLLAVSGGEKPVFHRGRCVVNPLKKCEFCEDNRAEFSSASALTVILTYYKLRDDFADSGFFRSLSYRIIYLFFIRKHRRAAGRFPKLEAAAAEMARGQAEAEQMPFRGIDRCAEPTAKMLSRMMENISPDTTENRVLYELGYYLGRWVYFVDAADDLAKDIKSGSFNPFAQKFNLNARSTSDELNRARDYANEVLNGTLARLGTAANLLECASFGPIIHNIVFLGLPAIQKEKLFAKENGNE